jgi:preprotein translocase subunit SecB
MTKDSANNPRIQVMSQFVVDFSFENPKGAESLLANRSNTKIDISVNLNAVRLKEPHYEVRLHIEAAAKTPEMNLFAVDLTFAGVFAIEGVENEENLEHLLFVYCPTLLFPFARRIIADATRDGGFLPLMIDPIDFLSMYVQQKKQNDDKKIPTTQH